MHISPWTEERIALLKQLKAAGELSSSQIAAELGGGISRNAVIGKQMRLGLPSVRTRTTKEIPKRKHRSTINDRSRLDKLFGPKCNAEPFQQSSVAIERLNINIVDLTANQCRWPTDDKDDENRALFCGYDRTPGSSYCPAHFDLSRNKNPLRPVNAYHGIRMSIPLEQ